MAKKPAPKPPSAPTTTQVMKRIAKTREAMMAAHLARSIKQPRGNALKKEGKPVESPG